MRLLRLEVADFGAVERADVELGPGLNVLHGPNDLGKSTLAAALRAALLLPHGSSAAGRFTPWHSDRTPTVALRFEVQGRIWRVTKTWGRGSSGSSLLEYSNDGQSFAPEEKGRGVDGKLRDLLGWGIAGPGGKGGKHGLPSSFLATVLLAEQASPHGVLDESLLDDTTDSGRQKLTEAMAALAQHPVFKAVLERAQDKVDEAFTATGKRKRAKDSPFARVSEQIAQRQAEYEQLRARLGEAEAVTSRLAELDVRRDHLMTVCADARERLETLVRDLERTRARARAQALLDGAGTRLQAILDQVGHVERGQQERAELAEALPELLERVDATTLRRQSAEGELHAAQTKLSVAQEGGASGTEHAGLERRRLQLEADRQRARSGRELAGRAVSLLASIEELDERIVTQTRELGTMEREQERLDVERRTLREAQRQTEDALRLRRLEEAERALAELRAARLRADEQRAHARALETEAAQLGSDPCALPDRAALERLDVLWDAARMAEAALGGGLSLEIDLHGDVSLGATVDGQTWPEPVGWRTFEAERSAELRIGDVATVRVIGGDVECRHAAEQARRHFADAAQPVLAAAQVEDLAGLHERVRQGDERRARVERLQEEASALLRLAEARDADDETLASAQGRVQEHAAALGDVDRDALTRAMEGADESELRRREAATAQQLAALAERREQLASRAGELRTQLEVASLRRAELGEALETTTAELERPPAVALAEAEAQLESLAGQDTQLEVELAALAEAERERVQKARAALERAREAAERARADESASRAELARQHERLSAVEATLSVHVEQLGRVDQEAAHAEVAEREVELQALPLPEQIVDADTVEEARRVLAEQERALDDVSDEVRKAEGALQQVGGEVVRERAAAAREALDSARREAAELELDYDAWQLLVETLRDAENEEGRNLGQVLGSAVAERFARLTRGRYAKVALSPDLATEGLHVAGDLRSVQSLSEGLKEQLATLLRISIAEQLSCALVLDDHLTQTDPARIGWFCDLLRTAAADVQVVVLTCRPTDYLRPEELPDGDTPTRDTTDGRVRAIDLARVIQRA